MVDSFLDRMDRTRDLDEAFLPFLEEHGFKYYPFGQTSILDGASAMLSSFKRLLVRDYATDTYGAGFMLKFAPDYVIDLPGQTKYPPWLLDTKASVVPIFFDAYLARLRQMALQAGCSDLKRGDVGEIEREAWDVYSSFFPKDQLAVCFAAPYNPGLLAMEWCSRIVSFYRFVENRNELAGGSGTPHVNIHLGLMRSPKQFLEQEFGVSINADAFEALRDVVKQWPIQKPKGRVNWAQYANTVVRIRRDCPWARSQTPAGREGELLADV